MSSDYQNAHQPEKHWQRFSRAVACSISLSTCAETVRTTSGLKSRPTELSSLIFEKWLNANL